MLIAIMKISSVDEDKVIKISNSDEERLKQLANSEDIYERLTKSIGKTQCSSTLALQINLSQTNS